MANIRIDDGKFVCKAVKNEIPEPRWNGVYKAVPFLKEAKFNLEFVKNDNVFPYNIPAFKGVKSIKFKENVTFFVGENGSGKSTLLEAIARICGFSDKGGGRNNLE